MTTIGAAWKKLDRNNKKFISVSIDEELLPLTIDKDKRISIFPIEEKPNDKAPDFRVVLYIPDDKNKDNKTTNEDFLL